MKLRAVRGGHNCAADERGTSSFKNDRRVYILAMTILGSERHRHPSRMPYQPGIPTD
jgi:hypothetical protein